MEEYGENQVFSLAGSLKLSLLMSFIIIDIYPTLLTVLSVMMPFMNPFFMLLKIVQCLVIYGGGWLSGGTSLIFLTSTLDNGLCLTCKPFT